MSYGGKSGQIHTVSNMRELILGLLVFTQIMSYTESKKHSFVEIGQVFRKLFSKYCLNAVFKDEANSDAWLFSKMIFCHQIYHQAIQNYIFLYCLYVDPSIFSFKISLTRKNTNTFSDTLKVTAWHQCSVTSAGKDTYDDLTAYKMYTGIHCGQLWMKCAFYLLKFQLVEKYQLKST